MAVKLKLERSLPTMEISKSIKPHAVKNICPFSQIVPHLRCLSLKFQKAYNHHLEKE
jgi:hypothetical protein